MSKRIIKVKEPYNAYFCRTGIKNGCTGQHSIKESVLSGLVLEALHLHIKNILNIHEIIAYADSQSVEKKEIAMLKKQISEHEKQLQKYRDLKLSLNVNLSNGLIDKTEYKEMGQHYSGIITNQTRAIDDCKKNIDDVLNNKSSSSRWMEHFVKYRGIESLDRRTLIALVDSIFIYEGSKIKILFAYADKYEQLCGLLKGVS
jgi:hypothetical protein